MVWAAVTVGSVVVAETFGAGTAVVELAVAVLENQANLVLVLAVGFLP